MNRLGSHLVPQRPTFHMLILVMLIAMFVQGCDSNTNVSYTAPVAPMGFSVSFDGQGNCSCSASVWTPVGTFAIGHTFKGDRKFSYIIIRDRNQGTDQVFAIPKAGRLEVNAVGQHTLAIYPQQDENKWTIETTSLEGTLEFRVFPAGAEIARVDLGRKNPQLAITSDRFMVVDRPGWFSRDTRVPLDSIDSITHVRRFVLGTEWLKIRWKPSINKEAMVIDLKRDAVTPAGLATFEGALRECGSSISYVETHCYFTSILILIGLLLLAILALGVVFGR